MIKQVLNLETGMMESVTMTSAEEAAFTASQIPTVPPVPAATVIYSPDGTPWSVTVNNDGDITTQTAV